ncbi:MAG: sulfur oxidation c-type cytochrome SoxX [Rhodospirillales bacterium]|nr:MAG: sulfur oxidation c-type cytochrome SoxX [Rhodospirillales bacterium]
MGAPSRSSRRASGVLREAAPPDLLPSCEGSGVTSPRPAKAGGGRDPSRSDGKARSFVAAFALSLVASAAPAVAQDGLRPYVVVDDAIPVSLTGVAGDPARGRAIVANRQIGLCLLCHSGPIAEERFQGTVSPTLAGAGSRWSEGQLRLRIVDPRRFNPATIMPSYYRTADLTRVARAFAGKPILTAEQVEDVVAYLVTLKD